MANIHPGNSELPLVPSSLQSALQMDQHNSQNQQESPQLALHQHPIPPLQVPGGPQPNAVRKRKKNENGTEEVTSPSEPRRLRRSHEACARCRSKKIKCDSKHPRCTACTTAGVPCHQEDRHRQTLTPRGHTERIEHQLAQCVQLLKYHIPQFDILNLDDFMPREAVDVSNPGMPPPHMFVPPGPSRGFPPRADGPQPPQPPPGVPPPKGYPYPPPAGPMMPPPPGFPPHPYGMWPVPPGYPPQFQIQGGPYPPPHVLPPPAPVTPLQPSPPAPPPPAAVEVKGQDPQANDMSNTQALAKSFGVHAAIVSDLGLAPGAADKEDLAVGSGGLTSGRDRDFLDATHTRDAAKWLAFSMRRNSVSAQPNTLTIVPPVFTGVSVPVLLPKDRATTMHVVGVYFTRLNHHRPVYNRADFEKTLVGLYEGQTVPHDPGYLCSLYLVLALGTLSELAHRASADGGDTHISPTATKKLAPDWPEHEEFFERALAVKPDLRVSISSLQALILLHWYLYTERQGRTLWRLVGSLVRLSIELGLHHDPTTQQSTFTEEECQLRIKLWGIVMVHDRGTSILLGRPLAISPSDTNTPPPLHPRNGPADFSEHFLLSHPIAEIQADIINSLYTPLPQTADTIMRNATRIIQSMLDFRKELPEPYKHYFIGTNDWPMERMSKLIQDITPDQGLTLLKFWIARILLMRALFSAQQLKYNHRRKALADAIVTSHNIIIIHNQLIKYPDIAFFTSPIPLHISAMVILYGQMSCSDQIPKEVATEDVWMALDMLPRFRWRWERKDVNGGHPLIARLAEQVLRVDLHQVGPPAHPVLYSELDWEEDLSPSFTASNLKSQQNTPVLANSGVYSASGPVIYGPQPRNHNAGSHTSNSSTPSAIAASTPPDMKQMMEVPPALFYPFYPETHVAFTNERVGSQAEGSNNSDFSHLLAAAAAQPEAAYTSQETFIIEEKDPGSGMQLWTNNGGQRGLHSYHGSPPS